MKKAIFASVALLAIAVAAPSSAATLFSDNFDSEGTAGASDLQYNAFSNWTVTGGVDLVKSPDYGIICSGKCVDLDGTPGPGAMLSNAIAFGAGNIVTISFDIGGSQRSADSDDFSFAALFASPTDADAISTLTGFPGAPAFVGDFTNVTSISYLSSVAGTAGFTTYSLSFKALETGSLQLSFGTTSADNVGPLLDNVSVAAVPEPATWAMMIGGFALVGASLRRRKAILSFA